MLYFIGLLSCIIILELLGCASISRIKLRMEKNRSRNLDYQKAELPVQDVPPPKFRTWLANLLGGYIRYRLICVGRIPVHLLRMILYKYVFLMDIGERVVIYGGAMIRDPWNIKIGDGSIIGDDCLLDGRRGITLGENVNFSSGVWIWTEQHDKDDPFFRCNQKGGAVIVGDRAWLSCRAIILPGVTIGEGAVIAAGAVVTNDAAPFEIIGGIPGKKIGMRNNKLKYEFDGTHLGFY